MFFVLRPLRRKKASVNKGELASVQPRCPGWQWQDRRSSAAREGAGGTGEDAHPRLPAALSLSH